ncbi:MAG: response regulator [Gammaproteobacteria bacterium]|nr:response regulator [Gammaproteobacteria bacterium]
MSARILVVDEKPESRGLLRIVLSEGGYEVVTAGNAEQAIELAEHGHFDAVVMDFFLPDQNGIDLALSLRRIRSLAGIPLIVFSAELDAELRQLGERAGISRWLGKPLPPDELLGVLDPLLSA